MTLYEHVCIYVHVCALVHYNPQAHTHIHMHLPGSWSRRGHKLSVMQNRIPIGREGNRIIVPPASCDM